MSKTHGAWEGDEGGWLTVNHPEEPKYALVNANGYFLKGTNMRRKITITVDVDYKDGSRFDTIMEASKQAARTILIQASFIADERPPKVTLVSDDVYDGIETIDIKVEDE